MNKILYVSTGPKNGSRIVSPFIIPHGLQSRIYSARLHRFRDQKILQHPGKSLTAGRASISFDPIAVSFTFCSTQIYLLHPRSLEETLTKGLLFAVRGEGPARGPDRHGGAQAPQPLPVTAALHEHSARHKPRRGVRRGRCGRGRAQTRFTRSVARCRLLKTCSRASRGGTATTATVTGRAAEQ